MADYGTIQTRVTASRAFLPLSGATVLLTRRANNGREELLDSQQTDRSGLTVPTTVPTPPVQGSLSPGTDLPFSTVDITVELSGFDPAVIRNVQVFPNTRTLQEVWLIPRDELSSRQQVTQNYDITPQDL